MNGLVIWHLLMSWEGGEYALSFYARALELPAKWGRSAAQVRGGRGVSNCLGQLSSRTNVPPAAPTLEIEILFFFILIIIHSSPRSMDRSSISLSFSLALFGRSAPGDGINTGKRGEDDADAEDDQSDAAESLAEVVKYPVGVPGGGLAVGIVVA